MPIQLLMEDWIDQMPAEVTTVVVHMAPETSPLSLPILPLHLATGTHARCHMLRLQHGRVGREIGTLAVSSFHEIYFQPFENR